MTTSMIVGGIAGLIGVSLVAVLSPKRACPKCAAPLPMVRKPGSARQAMLGGWTCAGCGCEIDRRGRAR